MAEPLPAGQLRKHCRTFYEEYPNVIKSWDFPSDPSLPRNYTPRETVPFLQLKFPYNMVRFHPPH